MKSSHLIFHALVLGLLNLIGIFLGFFIWKWIGGAQHWVQGWSASAIAFFGFWLWLKITCARGMSIATNNVSALGFWILASILPIAIFIPLHYFTQGYLTSMGNIEVLLRLILPTNFIVAGLMLKMSGKWMPKFPDQE
jgi:hypothetical protein